MPLKNTHKDDNVPLVILHIGKPRDLSITPLRFNPAVEVTEVCDISLGNLSLVTLFPDSIKHLHCYFSPELEKNKGGDEQVLKQLSVTCVYQGNSSPYLKQCSTSS